MGEQKGKIFEFNWNNGEIKEWVWAWGKETAIECYLHHTGCKHLDNTIVSEVPESKWKEYNMVDPNDFYDEEFDSEGFDNGYRITGNFKSWAGEKINNLPEYICSTEY